MRRLDQLLSSLGYCSRKEAQRLCEEGLVKVDGVELDDASTRVDPLKVTVEGEPLDFPLGLFVAFHKPVGLVCSHDASDGRRIYDVLPERWLRRDPKLTTIGRLDKDTSGLILLTDQGPLVQRLTSPKHHVEKIYQATLDGDVTDAAVAAFAKGIQLDGEEQLTLPAKLRALGPGEAEVALEEGRYHQVRRMFAAVGLHVRTLARTRFGPYSVEGLPEGEWKALPLP
jgi:16S rRNA pseudouridine516 synthase